MRILPTTKDWKSFWKDYKREISIGAILGAGYGVYLIYSNQGYLPTSTFSIYDQYIAPAIQDSIGYAAYLKVILAYSVLGAIVASLTAILVDYIRGRKK